MAKRLPFLFLLVLIPTAAWADIYVPSFVEMVSSPLMWSIYVVTIVITVPVILLIGLVETLAVRKYIEKAAFRKVLVQICILNAITSLIRLPYMGYRAVWPGLPVSYLLTIPIEAMLLWLFLRKMLPVKSVGAALVLSARMNTASYALLAAIVLSIVYLPVVGQEHPGILCGASGRLVINPLDEFRVLNVCQRKFVIGRSGSTRRISRNLAKCCSQGPDGTVNRVVAVEEVEVGKDYDVLVLSTRIGCAGLTEKMLHRVHDIQESEAVSRDGSLLVCKKAGKWVLYDTSKDKAAELPPALSDISAAAFSPDSRYLVARDLTHGQSFLINLRSMEVTKLGGVWDASFSPTGPQLAWLDKGAITIYDYVRKTRRSIAVRGDLHSRLAWSPDGRLLAAFGAANPLAVNRWMPEIRVIDSRTGDTATLYRDVFTADRSDRLLWVP